MRIRIISAVLAVPLFLFVVMKKGIILDISIAILALIAISEFYNAFKNMDIFPSMSISVFSIIFMFIINLKSITIEMIMVWFFINMLLILISNLFKKEFDILSLSITAMGTYYIVFFMYHIVFIAHHYKYSQLIWMIFIVAWATDTFAYFTGYFLGSRKLCPKISPKKTVEGAIGGILGSVIISSIFAYYVVPEILYHCILIGFLGSILGQLGDLTASIFKRYTGIKDFGKIMPGHGGILDRFDSILFTAPAVYYYIVLFIK
ncbi:phosphatidate cytidylyltransferase [Crassaminicella thermophila]|uniref:Phosphatidate cytidylyltransferase n=1 Tax=Crassaminicella thermophila TaxID=2599308 RepID=A0A5C0SG32_CRATE|nr:phosphatidate cytidylyltransferase [Crassaminicella thermophila]QEK12238.1 phosphatidate cytidylyltransferase [Crassaminicella thermophila]